MSDHRDDIARYLEGDLTIAEAAALEARAAEDPALAKQIADERALFGALSDAPPSFTDLDLVDGVRARRDAPAPTRLPRLATWGAGLAAAAALTFAVTAGPPTAPGEAEPVARGGAEDASKWLGLKIYTPSADAPAPLGETLRPHDELLFAYTNLGPKPATHLMVFGVDERSNVFWYHPPWTDPDEDPTALEIERGAADKLLPEAISHDLVRGRLTLHAWFLQAPLHVREVEALLGEGRAAPPGATTRTREVEVR